MARLLALCLVLGACGGLSPIRGPFDATLDVADRPLPSAGRRVSVAGACNGHAALCERRYDQVAFAATHNAMSSADEGWFQPNQQHALRRQLDDGVRALLLDTHYAGGRVSLCHGVCAAGRSPLSDALGVIAGFLRDNPREVVTLIFEAHVSAADTAAEIARAGLLPAVYTHRGTWPTLGEMIATGRRLVIFTEQGGGAPRWYHDLWAHAWETPYRFGGSGDFTCGKNRGTEGAPLFLLNHFVTRVFPSESASREVNQWAVLGARARECQRRSGRLPNFVAVDFYATGDLLAVVDALNGVATMGSAGAAP